MSYFPCSKSSSTVPPPYSTSNDSRRSTTSRRKHHKISLSPSRKRNVERWRREQRAAARDAFIVYHSSTTKEPSLSTVPDGLSQLSASLTCLPSTSDAFNLFPQRRRSSLQAERHDITHTAPISHMSADVDLEALRSSALQELQKSVAENGEGLVRKMRDWEHIQDSDDSRRGRKRLQSMVSQRTANEDDDVMIFSGEAPRADETQFWSPPSKKRAISAGEMDFELLEADGRSSSPVDRSSTFASDDENDSLSTAWDYTGSTTSATTSMSWSYSSEAPTNPFFRMPSSASTGYRGTKALSLPSSASRSEKAIAALTLAFANGAGGLTDYQELLNEQDEHSLISSHHVGELWD